MPIEFEDGRKFAVFETDNGRIRVEMKEDPRILSINGNTYPTSPLEDAEFPTREGTGHVVMHDNGKQPKIA